MEDLLRSFADILGSGGVLTGEDAAPYAVDWRGVFRGHPLAVVRPRNTAEVAAVVRLCAGARVGIVPQGGNTGLVGGATPDATGREIVLSLSRMTAIRTVDPIGLTVVAEAGATLRAVQDAAAAAGLVFPLWIASEGTATVGGVLAANAGGSMTIRHGNARDLALGIEAVLPDGEVFEGLRRLRKDNTGYSLRHLLIGSEGTLGIITAAVLTLCPAPRLRVTALVAVGSSDDAVALLRRLRAADPGAILAFEYMSAEGIGLVERLVDGVGVPLNTRGTPTVLLELVSEHDDPALRPLAETVLGAALEAGEALDAVLAESEAQRAALWRLREEHTEAQARAGASIKNDVSVPVERIPAFLTEATAACAGLMRGVRAAPFGHLGDGNIHFNLVQPEDMAREAFLGRAHEIMDAVAAVVRRHEGSFSAEHGVGLLKADMMPGWRGGAELDVMRRIKHAIDPDGIMNPGKLLPPRRET